VAADPFLDLLGMDASPSSARAVPPVTVQVPTVTGGDRAMGGGYEAADRADQALAMWTSPLRSADADILPDKDLIDGRARDMVRNDAFVQGAANLHKDNIVGAHFMLNTRPATRAIFGKEDDVWEAEFQEEVEQLWDLYSESPDNWIDAQRTNSFTSMVRLAVGIHLAAGEVLAAVEWLKDGRPFSTAIQMLDLDRLSDPQDRVIFPGDRADIRGGIRFDRRGAPQSYFIRTEHPSDIYSGGFRTMPGWKEVPIRKPWGRLQVIHIHEQVRPDQSRGVSELAASLPVQKMSQTFRKVNVQRAVMQSLYAAAITSELPTAEIFQRMGGTTADDAQVAVTDYATGYLAAVAQYAAGAQGMRFDGARIPHFFPGTKLEMLTPSSGHTLGMEFEASLLRYIAASTGVSYEQLSKDYSSTNYSSARAAMTETWKFMIARKKLVADRFASLIFRLWLEEAINKNEISTFPKRKAGLLYTNNVLNLKFDAISRCEWVGASRGQIDELKETQAAVLRITNGLSTAEDELARLGKDWRKVYRQLKREMAMREALGLQFMQTDPQTMAAMNALSANDSNDKKDAA
jgi:lambda family phage portal protein